MSMALLMPKHWQFETGCLFWKWIDLFVCSLSASKRKKTLSKFQRGAYLKMPFWYTNVQRMSHFEFRCRQVVVSLISGTLLHIMTLIHIRNVPKKPTISCKLTTYVFNYSLFLSKTYKFKKQMDKNINNQRSTRRCSGNHFFHNTFHKKEIEFLDECAFFANFTTWL